MVAFISNKKRVLGEHPPSDHHITYWSPAVELYLADWTTAECTWSARGPWVPGGLHPCGFVLWVWPAGAAAGGRTSPWSWTDTSTGPCQCSGLRWDTVSDRRLRREGRSRAELLASIMGVPHLISRIYASLHTPASSNEKQRKRP